MIRRLMWGALLALVSGVSLGGGAGLATAPVEQSTDAGAYASDGVVEAVRQSVLSTQVSGRVTALSVKAGDRVRSGQVLARVDEQAAMQQAAASQAQVAAAQSQLEAARRDYERNQQLYAKKYISQAAMERIEAQFKVASAQARATLAQAAAARTQTGLHTIVAPYAGIVASVPGEVGDMAMPGKPLIEIYDPRLLRVVTQVPETVVARLARGVPIRIELSGTGAALTPSDMTVMPTANPLSHTVEVRMGLPPGTALSPGLFARAFFPLARADGRVRLTVPASAVIKRTELDAVYVVDAQGRARLRQVRLGRRLGERIEVLAGLSAGERVALDPLAAARQSAQP